MNSKPSSPSPLDKYSRLKKDSEEKLSLKLNNLRREFQKIKEDVNNFNHTAPFVAGALNTDGAPNISLSDEQAKRRRNDPRYIPQLIDSP